MLDYKTAGVDNAMPSDGVPVGTITDTFLLESSIHPVINSIENKTTNIYINLKFFFIKPPINILLL